MPDYLDHVRQLPCRACGDAPPNDAHHLIGHGRLSMSMRVDDMYTFPLCRTCHGKLHDKGWKHWEHIYGNQMRHVAKTLIRFIRDSDAIDL